jgi:endonuclease/exonuclease/phosphatase family metal-dependent hydrolase
VIVVGDFNMPKELMGFSTLGFQKISSGLTDIIASGAPSFPSSGAVETKKFPLMQIDHAFTSPSLSATAGEVLPLRGSDHYPLYLILPI